MPAGTAEGTARRHCLDLDQAHDEGLVEAFGVCVAAKRKRRHRLRNAAGHMLPEALQQQLHIGFAENFRHCSCGEQQCRGRGAGEGAVQTCTVKGTGAAWRRVAVILLGSDPSFAGVRPVRNVFSCTDAGLCEGSCR